MRSPPVLFAVDVGRLFARTRGICWAPNIVAEYQCCCRNARLAIEPKPDKMTNETRFGIISTHEVDSVLELGQSVGHFAVKLLVSVPDCLARRKNSQENC